MEAAANIPPGLQALLSMSQELGMSMTAPGPQGEQPTIASQILQQASPQMQGIKQQAGIGAQIQAQQQAQKQKAAQDPDEIARRVAMLMQQGGIGALPVSAQFADGGIIGYNGEDESLVVPLSDETPAPQVTEKPFPTADQIGSELDAARDDLKSATENLYRYGTVQQKSDPRGFQAAREAVRAAEAKRNELQRKFESFVQQPAGPSQPPQVRVVGVSGPPGEGPPSSVSSDKAFPSLGDYTQILGKAPPAVPEKPEQRQRANTDYQIFSGTEQGPEPQINLPSGVAPLRPTFAEVNKGIGPLADYEAAIARQRNIEDARERFLAQQAPIEPKGIAALEKAQAAKEALAEKERKNDAIRGLTAWFRDLYTRGNAQDVVANGIKIREEQLIQGRLNTEKAKLDLEKAQQEREAGRFDRQAAFEARAFAMENEASKNFIQAAQVAANLTGSIYSADLKAYNDRLIANAQLLVELAKIREQAAANRETKYSNMLNSTQSRLNQALTNIRKEVEDQYGPMLRMATMAPQDGKPDPKLQKAIQDANALQKTLEERYGIPMLKQELDAVSARIMGTRTTRYDNAGNPVGQR